MSMKMSEPKNHLRLHLDFEGTAAVATRIGVRLLHLEDFVGPLGSTLDREKFEFFKNGLHHNSTVR